MSSSSDSEFDRFLSSCLKGAMGQAEPRPAVWESIERQVLSSQDSRQDHGLVHGLARAVKQHLLWLERDFFSVPVQYQRIADTRMAFLIQVMAYPGAGNVPLSFV
jgi:hypothetical protein